jgi:uncharacterized membrane protein YqhA
MKPVERIFERALWSSRFIVLVAAIASILVGFGMFFVSTVDAVHLADIVLRYAEPGLTLEARGLLRAEALSQIVEVVDGYLLATVMLIFALGLYELFVSKIEAAEGPEFASRVLLIRSLDDLKTRLAQVILLMLIVKFFDYALRIKYQSPLELLYIAVGILLVAAAIYLSHYKPGVGEGIAKH